jgi:hypothetical protein
VALVNGLLGVVAVLIGLSLGTNFNGGAEALAEATKSYRPLGSTTPDLYWFRRRFIRLFGPMMLVLGVVFVAPAVAQL